MQKKFFILLLLFFITEMVFSQKLTLVDRIKAEHIYNFGIYVKWKKNNIKTDRFYIGVCSKDTLMYDLLKRICKWRLIKWKRIEVLYFPDVRSIQYVQMLYVAQDMNEKVPEIDKIISSWSTLLITDSCHTYTNLMINFFPKNALKKVEINKELIEKRGMKVSPLLFTIAKKYEEDWESLFRKSEEELKIEKELVRQQQKILEEKSLEIKEKEKQVTSLSLMIEEKEKHLEQQKRELLKTHQELQEKIWQIAEKSKILNSQEHIIQTQKSEINKKKAELQEQAKRFENQKKILDEQEAAISRQKMLIDSQQTKLSTALENIKKQQLVLYFLGVVILLIGILAFTLYRNYQVKKKINAALKKKNIEIFQQKEEIKSQRDALAQLNEELVQKNEEITAQRMEIEIQRDEIAAHRDLVLEQKRQIEKIYSELTDSIQYAGRIQSAILPSEEKLAEFPYEHFIYYRPRDIISGDFYWFEKINNLLIFCVADCTGHGVPGAFMSMLGFAALHDAIQVKKETDTGIILSRTRDYIIRVLQQKKSQQEDGAQSSVKDGMDIALCVVNINTLELLFSGAYNPLYIIHQANNDRLLEEIKGDKMPLGIHERMENFTTHKRTLSKGTVIYLFSDGIADQFGGTDEKKFKYHRLKNLLIQISTLPMEEQKQIVQQTFEGWKGNLEQVDDVCLWGIRVG